MNREISCEREHWQGRQLFRTSFADEQSAKPYSTLTNPDPHLAHGIPGLGVIWKLDDCVRLDGFPGIRQEIWTCLKRHGQPLGARLSITLLAIVGELGGNLATIRGEH